MAQNVFFSMQAPRDLLAKAEHDLARLRANPISSYAAFDFFTTVRHLPDWLWPNDKAAQALPFAKYVELRICRHLADGAKHVVLTHKMHKQVRETLGTSPAFQAGAFQGDAFQVGKLLVRLDPSDPDTGLIGDEIEALDLAERLIGIARALVA